MSANSKIEWTHHTFNPWIGCQEVSHACDHCYARVMNDRWGWVEGWGPHGERKRTSEGYWRQPFLWNRKAKAAGERHRVFCASLADWLDNKVPQQWREDLAVVIEETPNLDWLLLTKRPENFDRLASWHADFVPHNVWVGTTAEDQPHLERRWAHLRKIDAVVRFISYEPALGPIRLGTEIRPDWLICGGESGSDARPMHPEWVRSIRDECVASGVAYFFKQWGEWLPGHHYEDHHRDRDPNPEQSRMRCMDWGRGLDPNAASEVGGGWMDDLGEHAMYRVGKKAAGRLLDGRVWDEMPTIAREPGSNAAAGSNVAARSAEASAISQVDDIAASTFDTPDGRTYSEEDVR